MYCIVTFNYILTHYHMKSLLRCSPTHTQKTNSIFQTNQVRTQIEEFIVIGRKRAIIIYEYNIVKRIFTIIVFLQFIFDSSLSVLIERPGRRSLDYVASLPSLP